MKHVFRLGLWLISGMLLTTGITWATSQQLGLLKPDTYQLASVSNHRPISRNYLDKIQKVALEAGNLEGFRNLPQFGMKRPYTGYISLGSPAQKFGVIVDIYGEEKRLYIDTNGDGSFENETCIRLINEWFGPYSWLASYYYLVIDPEPVTLAVRYGEKDGTVHQIEIEVEGNIFKQELLGKEKPFLLIQVRTWFLAQLVEDDSEKLAAIVDQNHNGCYNDPEDLLFIDYNNNGSFEIKESQVRKKGSKLNTVKQQLSADWDAYPEVLRIKEGSQ